MTSIAEGNSLFEIDIELDGLIEQIQEQIECEGQPMQHHALLNDLTFKSLRRRREFQADAFRQRALHHE
jgi:hypothetical protein